MNYELWNVDLLLERLCNIFGSKIISHTLQQEKKKK